jgi:RNA polymerase sigma factor (sigma-70 family)
MSAYRSDSQLLLAARRDANAFGEFYDRHAGSLLGWLRRETGDDDLAYEVLAETFAQALAGVHRFRGLHEHSGRAWLKTIATRVLQRYRDRGRLEARARMRLGVPLREDPDPDEEPPVPAVASAALAAAVRGLPVGQAAAVRLRVIDEMTYEQVADRLNCTQAAARLRVSRALRTLRSRIEGGVS